MWYALTHCHLTLKRLLEATLALPDLRERITTPDKQGHRRVNRYAITRLLYTLAPKGWALASLRDYLIGDATAMLQSHFGKLDKGKNLSNPPTLSDLQPYAEAQSDEAYRRFAETFDFPLKPQQEEAKRKRKAAPRRRAAAEDLRLLGDRTRGRRRPSQPWGADAQAD